MLVWRFIIVVQVLSLHVSSALIIQHVSVIGQCSVWLKEAHEAFGVEYGLYFIATLLRVFFFLNLYTYNKWNTTLLPTPRKAVYILILGTYCLAWQRDSEDLIRLRILRQRDYPELSGWAKCNYKGLYKRKPGNSEWEEGLKNTLLILKIEEGAIQEVQTSSRNWKR